MLAQFGIEASRAAQYVIAFAIILVLVALFGVVLRKLTGARLMMPGQDRGRSRQPRLGVVDIYDLDRQRQLVLLRRDNVEHLLLIGGLNDVVIETNIVRVPGARLPAAPSDTGAERFEPAFEQPPRPQVEGAARPSIETQLAAELGAFIRPPSEESDPQEELAPVASVSAPMPARPEPVLKPDAVTVSVTPPAQGAPGSRPAPFPQAPEPVIRRPEPGPGFAPPPPQPARMGPPPPPASPGAPGIVRSPQPAPAVQADKRSPDAAVLSDMAKQLEEALKRPASPVPPPAVMPPMPPQDEDMMDEDELLEPPAPPARGPSAPGHDAHADALPDEDYADEPEPRHPEPEPARPTPAAPPAGPQAAEPASPKPAPKAPDPFSVEEIEAEFARLLGRPLDSGKKD